MYYFDGDVLVHCLNKTPGSLTVDTFGSVYICNDQFEFVKVLLNTEVFHTYDRDADTNSSGPAKDEVEDIQFMIDDPRLLKIFRGDVKQLLNEKYDNAGKQYIKEA